MYRQELLQEAVGVFSLNGEILISQAFDFDIFR
jgi:hypothetical protein